MAKVGGDACGLEEGARDQSYGHSYSKEHPSGSSMTHSYLVIY